MKKILYIIALVLIFISCEKDKNYIPDKNNENVVNYGVNMVVVVKDTITPPPSPTPRQ